MAWTLILVLLAGGIAGFLVWRWVTNPVKRLTGQVVKLEQDSISVIKQLAQKNPDPAPANEIALLNNAFIELAQKIAQQWDLLADSDRQRREFYSQYFARFTHAADFIAGVSGNAVAESRYDDAGGKPALS
ncbi:HAMP domain [Citrobacter freundii]|nr:HAMP domain [Citrobacter freundii]